MINDRASLPSVSSILGPPHDAHVVVTSSLEPSATTVNTKSSTWGNCEPWRTSYPWRDSGSHSILFYTRPIREIGWTDDEHFERDPSLDGLPSTRWAATQSKNICCFQMPVHLSDVLKSFDACRRLIKRMPPPLPSLGYRLPDGSLKRNQQ